MQSLGALTRENICWFGEGRPEPYRRPAVSFVIIYSLSALMDRTG